MAFERCIADLEGGSAAFAFASGLAAIATTLECLDHGSHIIAVDDLYGGSRRLFERVRKRSMGLEVSYLDLTDAGALEAAIRPNTRLIWVETPTNPLLKLVDLERVAAIARSGAASGPRPTTPSPAPTCSGRSNTASIWSCIRPRNISTAIPTWSAASRWSATTRSWRERLKFLQNAVGAIQGPFDSFLALRGLKTLALRMERHCASALKIAAWLERHPKVRRVYYPGLASHPQHALAKKQMRAFGGMISAELNGTLDDARRFLERCQLFALAESLGGVESLIEHPALMTHGSVPPDVRATLGHQRHAGAALGRHRGCRRPHRRPRCGTGLSRVARMPLRGCRKFRRDPPKSARQSHVRLFSPATLPLQ